MIKNTKIGFLFVVFITLTLISTITQAQRPARPTDRQVEDLLRKIENQTNNFQNSISRAMNDSRYNGTAREDEVNRLVSDFKSSTGQLRNTYKNQNQISGEVRNVLEQGRAINNFMQRNRFNNDRNWIALKTDLGTLARYYDVPWQWDNGSYNSAGNRNNNRNSGRRLTGTYTLDTARNDNTQNAIDEATRGLNTQDAERVRNSLLRRLEAPEQLSFDQNGNRITIASTSATQVTLDADGRVQTETRPNGRTVRTTSTLNGNMLTIDSTGDRGNDFRVSFEVQDNGRGLSVTRRFDTERLSQPVSVRSYYNRTSESAQFYIYNDRGNDRGRDNNSNSSNNSNDRFAVPNDTVLTATLNNDLNTKDANNGDRFTLNVRAPGQYQNAVIEGQIMKVDRSGRVSGRAELALEFQRIRMSNGSSYDFTGYIEQVRNANGDKVTIDNEGSVKDNDSQTKKTVTRGGIGAAIGAIIGGIAGGGKGAGIGAVIGGGAGAGSVVVQGRDDLILQRGAEFSIRASAPRLSSQN